MNFSNYQVEGFFDEYFDENNNPRNASSIVIKRIESLSDGELVKRQKAA